MRGGRGRALLSAGFCRIVLHNDNKMRIRMRILALLAILAPALAWGEVTPPVLARLQGAGLPADSLAFTVLRADDGRSVAAHAPQRPMQPASTLKVLTSLVALETLGPAFRGRTEVLAAGGVERGVLHGDLVLRGLGDVDFDAAALEQLLRVVRLKGIRDIAGDVRMDRTFFDPPRGDIGVPPFDETPEFRYNVIPDALLLNTNLLHVDIASDAAEVRAGAWPPLEGVRVVPDFTLRDGACDDWEDGWAAPEVRTGRLGAIEIRLHGTFPRHCDASTAINVIDRVTFSERAFRAAWRSLGGRLRGRVLERPAPAGAMLVAKHESRPLIDVVRDVDKHSDNPTARVIYLTLGAIAGGDSSAPTAARAERVVRDWLAQKKIPTEGLVLENGSGLSRSERIAPATLAAVLLAGLRSAWAPELVSSLPIAAVDGGLRKRLADVAAPGSVRLKTGTLRNTSALAGYLRDARGTNYVICAMINDDAAKKDVARPILDALVEWLFATGFAGTAP